MGLARCCERLHMKNLWRAAAVAVVFLCAPYAHAAGLVPAKTTTVVVTATALKSTSSFSGYCWTASIASSRADAYRCMVGNIIHDPCFMLDAKSVACPIDPAENTGIRIALTKPLPQANPGNARNAWMMELAGQVKCNIGTGTVTPGYPFYCSGGLVCAAPPANTEQPAVFVACGRPKNATSVTSAGRYLVTAMYE